MQWDVMDMNAMVRNWWAIVLRGIAAVAFGVITMFAPGLSLAALIMLFAVYSIVDGIFALVSGFTRRPRTAPRWATLLQGLLGIAAGVATLAYPGITALALLYLIAAWAITTGAFEVVAAIRLRREIEHEWLLGLSGVLSVVLGGVLILAPARGALAVVLWIGAYALASGLVLVALGIRLRLHKSRRGPRVGDLRTAMP